MYSTIVKKTMNGVAHKMSAGALASISFNCSKVILGAPNMSINTLLLILVF